MTDLAATVRERGVYQLNSEQDAALAELVRLAEQRGEVVEAARELVAMYERAGYELDDAPEEVDRLAETLREVAE